MAKKKVATKPAPKKEERSAIQRLASAAEAMIDFLEQQNLHQDEDIEQELGEAEKAIRELQASGQLKS